MTAAIRARASLPARQAAWTRLGVTSGFTDTETKRAGIRAAVAGMAWVEPTQLAEVLATGRVRHALTGVALAPGDVLRFAAVTTLPSPGRGWEKRRLIGLQTARADRYLLLDDGRQAFIVWHDTAVGAGWVR